MTVKEGSQILEPEKRANDRFQVVNSEKDPQAGFYMEPTA